MKSARSGLALTILLFGISGPTVYGATEDDKITADVTTTSNALFGHSVDMSGTTVVVGSLGNNTAGAFAGSAYVFDCGSFPCVQVSKLTASDAAGGDTFGWSVAVSGANVVVGAIEDDASGSAYYFDLSTCGASCTETSKLTASDATRTSKFGFSVGVSGTTAVVGVFRFESAYLFDLSTCGAACNETSKLTASDAVAGDRFGLGVAISGATVLVGAPLDDDVMSDSGSAYVFDCSSSPCVQVSKLTASDAAARAQFGERLTVSGATAVVGTGSLSESAYYFDLSACGAACTETGRLTASDAVAGDSFGAVVAVSGTTAVIGAPTDDDVGRDLSGSAYSFDLSTCGAACNETSKLTASDARAGDKLGSSVAVSEAIAVVGAPNDDAALVDSGSAYVFVVSSDTDGDGVPDDQDICPGGDDTVDTDGDGVPDYCDLCPLDPDNDSDGDEVCDSDDLCLGDDATGDSDADGVCDDLDPCFGSPNDDADGDGVCDGDDVCSGNDTSGDSDGDGVCDDVDLCLGNDASGDTDADGTCNDIDVCPLDPENDADADGLCADEDNCPAEYNPNQADNDGDTVGDECDPDDDNDGVDDGDDNCPFDPNPGQEDYDGDGDGDVCDEDDDGDGVGDADDSCPGTDPSDTVSGNGCSIAQLCPCESDWKNHGAYVRCVAHTSEVFVELDLITEAEKDVIVSEAAESTCGHKK